MEQGKQGYITSQFGFTCEMARFGCRAGLCQPDPAGRWANPTCDAACQLPTTTTPPVPVTSTTTTTVPAPGRRYSCSGARCVPDVGGPFASANCGGACEAPPPAWPTVAVAGCQAVGFDLGDADVYPTHSQLVESNNDPSDANATRLLSLVRLDYADAACTLGAASDLVVALRLEALRPPSPAGEAATPLAATILGGPGSLGDNLVTVHVQNASLYIGNGWVPWRGPLHTAHGRTLVLE